MESYDENDLKLTKAKVKTKLGCFFGVIILGLLFISLPIWLYFSLSKEIQLEISHSPHNINTVEVVKVDDFPDPTIRIKYEDQSIIKTKIPDNISIEWENDYEATVILTKKGREPQIVPILFEK